VADKWFAECIPCKWETQHDDEDSAIRASVKHVNAFHVDIPPEERGAKKMGHVQNRTVGALATSLPEGSSAGASTPDPGGTGATASSAPAPGQPSTITIDTPKGEIISIKE